MKKLFLTFALFVFTNVAFSQEDKQETDQDKMQQEPVRPTQRELERAARADAGSKQSEKDVKARRQAKAKSRAQKQRNSKPMKDTVR